MTRHAGSLGWLAEVKLDDADLALDHAMDISGTIYTRMNELDLKQQDLAKMLNVTPARISRIISGKENLTLKTIARLENALDMDMSEGFRHPTTKLDGDYRQLTREYGAQGLVGEFPTRPQMRQDTAERRTVLAEEVR